MAQAPLKCSQPAAREIYEHLISLDQAGTFPKGLKLDSGYRVLDYRNSSNPEGDLKGKNDGWVQCQELWENGLKALDKLGEIADWEEDPDKAKDITHQQAIERYQAFRELVECKTGGIIPWVFEAPYICQPKISSKGEQKASKDKIKLEKAKKIRDKVRQAIKKLEILLSDLKEKDEKLYKKRMIAGLYWFVWMADTSEEFVSPEVNRKKHSGLYEVVINPIKKEIIRMITKFKHMIQLIEMMDSLEQHGLRAFAEYLLDQGGLGMSMAKGDAPLEVTALEMAAEKEIDPETGLLIKRGWCTEQSKVLYAVLRMAGIDAFFIEPRLSVNYLKAKQLLGSIPIPLPGHIANGVGVEIEDEKGNVEVWILDMALRMLYADYVDTHVHGWKAHPFWKLSLRHYWMVDLSNLGVGHSESGNKEKAEENYKLALELGRDSTAHYAFANYGHLLCDPFKNPSATSIECRNAYSKIRKSLRINPHVSSTQFFKGWYLNEKRHWKGSTDALLKLIEFDPRYREAYQNLGRLLFNVRRFSEKQLSKIFTVFEKEIKKTIKLHPDFVDEIKKGFFNMEEEVNKSFDNLIKEEVKRTKIAPDPVLEKQVIEELNLWRDELLNNINELERKLQFVE